MERSSVLVPFPLLSNPDTYDPSTMKYRREHDKPDVTTPTEKIWINIFRKSVPSYTKRAAEDDSVVDAPIRAEKFAKRFLSILDDIDKDPRSHGGPPSCMSLCRLRELVLLEVGFEDIFKKVKEDENQKALWILPSVIQEVQGIEKLSDRLDLLIRGVFAGNIFDLGASASVELFETGKSSFGDTRGKLLPRPWIIDDLDDFKIAFATRKWKKVVIFCDNSGADVVLGILPLALEFLKSGAQVVLAANDRPAINDITYSELLDLAAKIQKVPELDELASLLAVGRLLIVNSGSDLPVIDLSEVSQELAYVTSDADLVVLEGMGRSIETNLGASFKCDSLNIGMVKHQEVADFLGGRLYDCVIKFTKK